jgi:nucleotide-binding universal stress UspA family protein
MLPIHTILHPTDFSPQSGAAFQLAWALARDYGARMILLHVKPPDMIYGEGYVLPPDPPVTRAVLQEQLDRLQPPDSSVRVERILREGYPADAILHAAAETGADLIVMGTLGRTGVGRLLMGSVAQAVLCRAPCPVLTVKAPPPKDLATTEAPAEQVASGPGLIH